MIIIWNTDDDAMEENSRRKNKTRRKSKLCQLHYQLLYSVIYNENRGSYNKLPTMQCRIVKLPPKKDKQ